MMMKFQFLALCLGAAAAGMIVAPGVGRAADEKAAGDAQIVARSLVSPGDTARLRNVMLRARRGENVTVAVIGGSITQGAKASNPENRYGNLVAKWWRETFPKANFTFVNAGIGATGTSYAVMRLERDLLSQQPDFVVIEFAVNDGNSQGSAETLEGVVRQIMKQPKQPATTLLFMVNKSGGNAQEWFTKVGEHYRLPMVSYRDALWPEIEAGRLKWDDISPDEVHPNDRGHADAARFVTTYLESVLKDIPADAAPATVAALPAPLFSDLFDSATLLEGEAMKPVANSGWTYDAAGKFWKSDVPGSTIEFEVPGRTVYTMHYVVRGPMGRASVRVDDGAPVTLDGWFAQTWGGYRQANRVAPSVAPGVHRVRFELLPVRNPGSDGHEFRILGIGATGTAVK